MSVEPENLNANYNLFTSKIEEPPKVMFATWAAEDRVKELDEILQDASFNEIERQFQKYVEENIEPVGWRAVWRSQGGAMLHVKIDHPMDFIVDVVNVSQAVLGALVNIKEIKSDDVEEILIDDVIGKEVSVSLMELFPTCFQDNEVLNIVVTTEVLEHLRFFYNHILLPWDAFEEICHYNKHLLSSRIKTYEQIQNGTIPRRICSEMMKIKDEAKKIAKEISAFELKMNSNDMECDQFEGVRIVRFTKQLEFLKERYDALKDPVLRELSAHEQQLERKHILSSLSDKVASILLVASVEMDTFIKCIRILPSILNNLQQIHDISRIQTYPSLQVALDVAHERDAIILFPGSHELKNLGALSHGGTIVGLGDDVEILGSFEAGDILMDLKIKEDALFTLQSVILKPLTDQAAIFVHSGKVLMDRCLLTGGSVGIALLNGSECKVKDSIFANQEKFGIEIRDKSKLHLNGARFEQCQEAAIQTDDFLRISVEDSYISDCIRAIKILGTSHKISENNSESSQRWDVLLKKFVLKNIEETCNFVSDSEIPDV